MYSTLGLLIGEMIISLKDSLFFCLQNLLASSCLSLYHRYMYSVRTVQICWNYFTYKYLHHYTHAHVPILCMESEVDLLFYPAILQVV